MWRSGNDLLALHDGAWAHIVLDGPDGAVLEWYGDRSYSDEDDLWVWAHVVEGDRLVMRTTVAHGAEPPRVVEEKVVLGGLRVETSASARRLVATALAAAEASSKEAHAAQERVAEARLDAIEGARAELGATLEGAQRALGDRIRRWDDERAKELLATLVVLGRAKLDPAVEMAFARGCLLACFVHDIPALPGAPTVAADPTLAARLAAHADALARDADGQEDVDAHANAAALAGAAGALRLAASWLGYLP